MKTATFPGFCGTTPKHLVLPLVLVLVIALVLVFALGLWAYCGDFARQSCVTALEMKTSFVYTKLATPAKRT